MPVVYKVLCLVSYWLERCESWTFLVILDLRGDQQTPELWYWEQKVLDFDDLCGFQATKWKLCAGWTQRALKHEETLRGDLLQRLQ